ncbi:MAG: four helix bundle protein [Bacteroidales bacterium]|nr:four helix bundle protein [Bacteroidales bacterium]
MEKRYLKLNDINAYKIAFNLSNSVWDIVIEWDWFAKKHVGGQFVEAVDSISANLAEGFGRYHKKDKIKFYRYSQGSIKECFDWNEKSKMRKLLTDEQYQHILEELQKLPQEINHFIQFTNQKLTI